MEPTYPAIGSYRIVTTVKRVEFRRRLAYAYKKGEEVIRGEEDLGWYVVFEGSWEALYIGDKEPNLKVGETVSIIIRKHTLEVQDA